MVTKQMWIVEVLGVLNVMMAPSVYPALIVKVIFVMKLKAYVFL